MTLRSFVSKPFTVPTVRFTVPIVFIAFCVIVAILVLLRWSGHEVDRIAHRRDRAIVSLVLDQSVERIAHAQESSTVWDEAVLEVRKQPLDQNWLDLNLGEWFEEYAGIDEVYILTPDDRPLYAMTGGRRTAPESYIAIEDQAGPLVTRLRKSGATPHRHGSGQFMLTHGQADFAVVRGRPAIISVKPIVSDSGALVQVPGHEAVHIAVVFLDADFFAKVASQPGLAGARYQIAPGSAADDASVALHSHDGNAIGYLVWKPFAPGSRVTSTVRPLVVVVLLLCTLAIAMLANRLAKRTGDLEESRRQAQHQATHDGLTGLGNRVMFEARLDEALAHSRRSRKLLALLYIDLDRFKQVNDTLGHPAGDALIRKVAGRLMAEVRGYDVVARLGGDEFAILISEPLDVAAVHRICARIVAEIERPFTLSGSQAYIGASIGVAIAPENGLDRTELTRKADIALYKAKAEGRSRYVFFSPGLDEDVRSRETTYHELRRALADCDRQLRVHYQPMFSTATGAMTGVEALLRWEHPQLGLVGPAEFIHAAEESGLIGVLGEWILRRAVEDARAWPALRVSVNVSPIQLRDRRFVDCVKRVLAESNVAPDRLEVELTETALMAASDDVALCLGALREIGVASALDDFGTGYSSLSHIRDFAVDRIKIDRSFVQAVDTDAGAALVLAIVGLARANGLELTAEGVETEAQLAFMRKVGCHEVQGYLMSRAVPCERITAMLRDPPVLTKSCIDEGPGLKGRD